MRRLAACLLAGLALGQAAPAQQALGPVAEDAVRSPLLTIDPDTLFAETRFGQRITEEVRAETEALAAENRRIEAELTEQEKDLTERRATMSVTDFRAAADAFDARVQEIRREQDAKERALQTRLSEGQDAFLIAVRPILGRMMIDRGAAVILDRRNVFLGVGLIDMTSAAIAEIDRQLGDGSAAEPAPAGND